MPGLTHHQILPIVEPFARCGLRLDMAGSDRLAGLLRFTPVQRPADATLPAGSETWELGCLDTGWFRLIRRVALADEMLADVHAEGTSPAGLLCQLQAVPPDALFCCGRRLEFVFFWPV